VSTLYVSDKFGELPFCDIQHSLVDSEAVGNNLRDRDIKELIRNHAILLFSPPRSPVLFFVKGTTQ
jgi:hypothetical protein